MLIQPILENSFETIKKLSNLVLMVHKSDIEISKIKLLDFAMFKLKHLKSNYFEIARIVDLIIDVTKDIFIFSQEIFVVHTTYLTL